jgi:fatty-acyl-CoA synthase
MTYAEDMIIRGGENISPREIEEFLYTHPDVAEVHVVGLPDERYGEEIAAFGDAKRSPRQREGMRA